MRCFAALSPRRETYLARDCAQGRRARGGSASWPIAGMDDGGKASDLVLRRLSCASAAAALGGAVVRIVRLGTSAKDRRSEVSRAGGSFGMLGSARPRSACLPQTCFPIFEFCSGGRFQRGRPAPVDLGRACFTTPLGEVSSRSLRAGSTGARKTPPARIRAMSAHFRKESRIKLRTASAPDFGGRPRAPPWSTSCRGRPEQTHQTHPAAAPNLLAQQVPSDFVRAGVFRRCATPHVRSAPRGLAGHRVGLSGPVGVGWVGEVVATLSKDRPRSRAPTLCAAAIRASARAATERRSSGVLCAPTPERRRLGAPARAAELAQPVAAAPSQRLPRRAIAAHGLQGPLGIGPGRSTTGAYLLLSGCTPSDSLRVVARRDRARPGGF